MIAGCSVIAGPLTSTMPSSSPVRGSCSGSAVQYHGCWSASKCSAENSCTGLASASAVPIAFVPTRSSVHSAPSANPSPSARVRTRAAPSRHRMIPSASVTTIRNCDASATEVMICRSSSTTSEIGEARRRASTCSVGSGSRGLRPSGSSPARSTRDQDRATSGRGCSTERPPAITASCMRTSSRA